ncbi:cation:proton antiporter [Neoehrlichia mikurensis]|uniref:Cation:proton antiporter n=1 Tax=Neoehrlichia mikurensis TaxID=89586 RepID=A0A9Q9BV63_9RICK|nr:proton-conducting transporter membrane subunit [Neoehrlichia mikurensis]QXK91844.1 cation:proton antiporter [Neoehrlichia mikurensis]QXK93057.1 cation:proton antiporter [Neoehrlichia mikurensis]QXK93536.1 cation:proton antiporter [Neoehrlichia mikurensis]UTO55508.1 cation:proton antiporter [Neoehrlichia mikurensis]UTO56430.1 cation:proton antiporter [Neoehrlichia mikurensis]
MSKISVYLNFLNSNNGILLIAFSLAMFFIFLSSNSIGKREMIIYLLYYLSNSMAILSSDIIIVVIVFEFMALCALLIIAISLSKERYKAFIHYACIHFCAGVFLLIGICQFSFLKNLNHVSAASFFIGLLINAAAFPMSSWVTHSYPIASNTGMAILSVFTTKTAAYIMLKLFQGSDILLYVGLMTSIYGVIFSLLENNIKKLLCYNLVGQMGLLLISIGFNHMIVVEVIVLQIVLSMLYQLLLFMIANAIIKNTGIVNINDMGCMLKTMPLEGICCFIALLIMGGFPGTSGFIVKTMILHNIELGGLQDIIFGKLFFICSILLLVSAGFKFFWFVFLSNVQCVTKVAKSEFLTQVSILILTCILLISGFFYKKCFFFVDNIGSHFYYTYDKVFFQCITFLVAALFFYCFYKKFKGITSFNMDIDWIYRSFLLNIILKFYAFILYICNIFANLRGDILYVIKLCNNKDVIKNCGITSLSLAVIMSMLFISSVVVFLCLSR